MIKDCVACGDVFLDETYSCVKEVVVIWNGINNQPLVVDKERLEMEEYSPFWSSYNGLVRKTGHFDIKKAITSRLHKKPIFYSEYNLPYDAKMPCFKCPNCGEPITYIEDKEEYKFCYHCGQAIDWE